ncbi:MAG: DUF7344 domain-containing protein [Halolamina sp.]
MGENGQRTGETRKGSSRQFGRQFYRALASTERRRLLQYLLDGEERTVDEIATVLVGWEVSESGTIGGPEDRNRTLLGLHHVHLPMLDDAGLVAYDRDRGTVRIEPLDPTTVELVDRGVEREFD